jgi:hypothetical protein
MITSLPSMAILIDCWQSLGPRADANKFYNTICTVLDSNPAITIVVLASNDADDFLPHTNNIWYANKRSYFKHSEKTADIILDYKNPKKFQIAITELENLQLLLKNNPQIKNVYFMGGTWGKCLHDRLISITQQVLIKNKNVLVDKRCVWKEWDGYDHIVDMDSDIDYIKIDENLYMLKQND